MLPLLDRTLIFNAFMVACGVGLGALGFAKAEGHYKRLIGRFEVIGGVDVDPIAVRAFTRLLGVPCTELDLFTREQYTRFHGHEPPAGWREATGADFRRAARGRRPHTVFSSSPCKGLSALLNNAAAESDKYQALNELVDRSIDLTMDAWGDDPPEFILIENVPRILTRGREILDRVKTLLDVHGYASVETVHDCGELGGLAQHRQRFLLVARHRKKVRPHLWEPPKKRVRGVGEVIGALPVPGAAPKGRRGKGITSAEAMHKVPNLKWLTWLRLALIEAGSDWRSLEKLGVENGYLRDVGIVPAGAEWHNGVLGVRGWQQPSGTVTGESLPFNGAYSVSDPRCNPEWAKHHGGYGSYGVLGWGETAPTVTGRAREGGGRFSVADPRTGESWGGYGVLGWDDTAGTITSARAVGTGGFSVADPRAAGPREGHGKYRVTGWEEPAGVVIAASTTGEGAFAVADPRAFAGRDGARFNNVYRVVRWDDAAGAITGGATPSAGGQSVADPRVGSKRIGGAYETAGHYGVLRWQDPSPAVTGSACHDNGAHSVADVRMPDPKDKCAPLIIALDGTWHRPLTTCELAALQGFPVLEAGFAMEGTDSQIREHVGNGVPREAGEAIGSTMLSTLLMHAAGDTFRLSADPIWVVPGGRVALDIAIAIGVDVGGAA